MAAEFMQYLNPVGLGPSSKDVLNVRHNEHKLFHLEPFQTIIHNFFYSVLFKGA
jgi:hypothetical protein